MKQIVDLIAEVPVLEPIEPPYRELIAGCGRNRVYEPGEYLFREGDVANTFHVIREGAVALETFVPGRGARMLETLHEGDLLGWSWLFPPYRASFDARAAGRVHAIEFDAACLRGKLEGDHELGYELLRVFSGVIVERLQATRMRLLDLYGPGAGG